MTERQLQDAIVAAGRALGWMAYHTFDSRKSAAGFPDLVLVKAPRITFAELKTAKGVLSDEQLEWQVAFAGVAQAVWTRQCVAEVGDRGGPLISVKVWRPSHWLSGEIELHLRGRER